MSEILLVNPRRRRRRKTKRKAARRKNPIRRATRRTSRKRARRRNPIPGATRKVSRRAKRRRNPSFSKRSLQGYAIGAAKGAAGAIALDVALAYIPLPANLKAGYVGKAVKAFGAVALGVLAKRSRMVTDATARDMTVGALTVQFTGFGRELLGQFAPGVALAAYIDNDEANQLGYAGSGWTPSQSLDWGSSGMGAYMNTGYDIAAPGDAQPGLDGW